MNNKEEEEFTGFAGWILPALSVVLVTFAIAFSLKATHLNSTSVYPVAYLSYYIIRLISERPIFPIITNKNATYYIINIPISIVIIGLIAQWLYK